MPHASPVSLDRETIRQRLQNFATHWRGSIDEWRANSVTHTEKTYAQQFWSDMLRCFGVIPERITLFEQDAVRASTGRSGYIDLFWSGVVLGEAKSLGADLDRAYSQASDYLTGGSIGQHEFPKFIMVSDFENLRLSKLGDDAWNVNFTIDEFPDYVDQLMFLAGRETVTKREEEEASIHASRLMADLFRAMLHDDVDEAVGDEAPTNPEDEDAVVQRTSMWMTRLLFLLFGDDAGLWEEDLFYRFVLHDTTASNLGSQLNGLFQVLNTPEGQRRRVPPSMEKFPYVNGSVFQDHMPQEFFDEDMREALLAACRFHWTRISPAVFGAMFQLVKSKEARRADGEHYTSETNILKVLEPLFLHELRADAARLIRNKSTTAADLRRFRDKMAQMVFMDPACGCGNFLVVAYRELRAIETDIIVALRAKEGQHTASMDISFDQRLTIDQFHGIEINWWPAKIAETAMFLADHQANRALAAAAGDAPNRLPITITAHIHHGNALAMDWAELLDEERFGGGRHAGPTYVFGNPPFIGQYTKTKEQTDDMKTAWGQDYTGYLDYVTGWHAQTIKLLHDRLGEFAYVTTNSIVQGQPVPALFDPLYREGWDIKFAHRTFSWDSEAPGKAAVHCVVVGFTRIPVVPRYTEELKAPEVVRQRLWDYVDLNSHPIEVTLTSGINAYLTDGPRVLVTATRSPLSTELPPVHYGSKPSDGGNLVFKANDGNKGLDQDPIALKYLRRFVGAKEMLHNVERWCLWLPDADPADIRQSTSLQHHLRAVKKFREESTKKATQQAASTPSLFTEIRQPDVPYLCIPRHVSETRRYWTAARNSPEVICGDANFLAPDEDGLLFALISSSMFITWQRAVGGRIKSDLRFSNTLTWNTFPVPKLESDRIESITDAGAMVLNERGLHPERSLADAYNPLTMDPSLIKAHDALDREVDKAFGAPRKLSTEEQRLELLFENYVKLTTSQEY